MESSSLNLPIALLPFASPPPSAHIFSCISISKCTKHIVTGAQNGTVCLWSKDKNETSESAWKPRIWAKGHSAPVVAVVFAIRDTYECALSVGKDGGIAVWKKEDGECLVYAPSLLKEVKPPTSAAITPDGRYVLVTGGRRERTAIGSGVFVIDVWTMRLLARLGEPGEAISSVDVKRAPLDHVESGVAEYVLSTGSVRGGCVRVTCLPRGMTAALDVGLFLTEQGECIDQVVLAPGLRVVLLLTRKKVMLYSLVHSRLLGLIEAPPNEDVWKRASFVEGGEEEEKEKEEEAVPTWILFSSYGHIRIYSFSKEMHAFCSSCTPISALTVKGMPVAETTWPDGGPSDHVQILSSLSLNQRIADAVIRQSRLYIAFQVGEIIEVSLPALEIVEESRGAWASVPPADTPSPPLIPTCSYVAFLPFSSVMIRGFQQGELSLDVLPFDPSSPSAWSAHSGAILCLSIAKYADGHVRIISGGEDATVRQWRLTDGTETTPPRTTLEHIYKSHVARVVGVRALGLVSGRISGTPLSDCFLSIGRDRCVCMMSVSSKSVIRTFADHPSQIQAVHWQPAQDLLLVHTIDTNLIVWEISSGEREGVAAHEDAINLREASEALWSQSDSHTPCYVDEFSPVRSFVSTSHIDLNDPRREDEVDEEEWEQGVGLFSGFQPSSSTFPPPLLPNIIILPVDIRRFLSCLKKQLKTYSPISPTSSPRTTSTPILPRHHIVTLIVSYFIPWHVDDTLDQLCTVELGLSPIPSSSFLHAVEGSGRGYALQLMNRSGHAFCTSDSMSASHSMAVCSFAKTLMTMGMAPNACSSLLSFVCALLPEKLSTYVSPSLSLLTLHWFESNDDILESARALFSATLNRFSTQSKSDFARAWAIHLQGKSSSRSQVMATLVLAILGSTHSDVLSSELSREVASRLEGGLYGETGALQVACGELLGRGYPTWKPFLRERMDGVVTLLFCISMPPPAAHPNVAALHAEWTRLSLKARHALLQIGLHDAHAFLLTLSKEIHDPHQHSDEFPMPAMARALLVASGSGGGGGGGGEGNTAGMGNSSAPTSSNAPSTPTSPSRSIPSSPAPGIGHAGGRDANGECMTQHPPRDTASYALRLMAALIKKNPTHTWPFLPRIVEIVVRSLDPHAPRVREGALAAITQVIHVLVHHYPMVSFHQESQRLAVGTADGQIILYDLKTSSRWHVLEGHSAPLNAVSFSENGKLLASYSIQDGAVKIWVATSSFFGMGSPYCKRTFPVPRPPKAISAEDQLTMVRVSWESPNAIVLLGWDGSLTLSGVA